MRHWFWSNWYELGRRVAVVQMSFGFIRGYLDYLRFRRSYADGLPLPEEIGDRFNRPKKSAYAYGWRSGIQCAFDAVCEL